MKEKNPLVLAGARQVPEESVLTEAAARRKLTEMNLLEDFLFGSLVAHPEMGERFIKILLKTIFGREFRHISVTAQKVFYGTDSDLHGTRLDVYIESEAEDEEDRTVIYDVEPDRRNNTADKKALPRRVRFYHGKIVGRSLNSGAAYEELKDVMIIMILPYDPFGQDRMLYTVKNQCLEEPQMEYEDGATTLFLYTRGTKGVPSEKLKQFLHYMENSTSENAVNDDLKEVHRMVELIKLDAKTTVCCVGLTERLERSRREAMSQGLEEGKAQGLAEGKAQGLAEGRAEGEVRGNLQRLVLQVCKKRRQGQSTAKIAEDLMEEITEIESICKTADECGYVPEMVLKALSGENQAEVY